jgi:hypothetical protein
MNEGRLHSESVRSETAEAISRRDMVGAQDPKNSTTMDITVLQVLPT